jgi:hypothetical protein
MREIRTSGSVGALGRQRPRATRRRSRADDRGRATVVGGRDDQPIAVTQGVELPEPGAIGREAEAAAVAWSRGHRAGRAVARPWALGSALPGERHPPAHGPHSCAQDCCWARRGAVFRAALVRHSGNRSPLVFTGAGWRRLPFRRLVAGTPRAGWGSGSFGLVGYAFEVEAVGVSRGWAPTPRSSLTCPGRRRPRHRRCARRRSLVRLARHGPRALLGRGAVRRARAGEPRARTRQGCRRARPRSGTYRCSGYEGTRSALLTSALSNRSRAWPRGCGRGRGVVNAPTRSALWRGRVPLGRRFPGRPVHC